MLAYRVSASGLCKTRENHPSEVRQLRTLKKEGVKLYQVPDLHAKGVVTPLGVIPGSTNLTRSGLYAQIQNANYFAHNHVEYASNRSQLLASFRHLAAGSAP